MPFGLVKTDQQLLALARDGAANEVGFGRNQRKKFVTFRQLAGKPALFINCMTRVEKRRDIVFTEDGFEFFDGQRFLSVIAFNQLFFVKVVAQETPRVAASRSGGFAPKIYFHGFMVG